MKLSVIIPCYNEKKSVLEIIKRVEDADLGDVDKEIIVVDDGSSDSTTDTLKEFLTTHKVIYHEKNQGKGAAIRTGLAHITGDYVVIQDADLEYDPQDFKSLIQPLLNGDAEVVYGTRTRLRKYAQWRYYAGGVFLTNLTNFLYGSKITDEPTCYKMFKTELIKSIPLTCTKFEFCPEVTAKILKKGIPIVELPISYNPRSKSEGKKINWKDGVHAIWTLFKYRIIN